MLVSLFLVGAILSFDAADVDVFSSLEWYDILGNGAREAVASIHSPFWSSWCAPLVVFCLFLFGLSLSPAVFGHIFLGVGAFPFQKSEKRAPFSFFLYSTLLSLDFSAMAGMTSTPYSDFLVWCYRTDEC